MFTKHGTGASTKVNLKYELAVGMSLGVVAGLAWKVLSLCLRVSVNQAGQLCPDGVHSLIPCCLQVHHWNEKRKQAEYYTTLAKLESQKQ